MNVLLQSRSATHRGLLVHVLVSFSALTCTTISTAVPARHKHSLHATQTLQQSWQPAVRAEQERILSGQRRLLAGFKTPHEWPGYLIPDRDRHLGLAFPGDWGRLRAALARRKRTGNLTISIVGGSISAGAGALNTHNWVEWLEDWLGMEYNGTRDAWVDQPPRGDPRVRVANGAVPGTYSSYMSVCYSKHVPKDADIIVVEYALNDEFTVSTGDRFDNLVRRAFERLLRKLLNYPKKPAVVLLNAYSWFQVESSTRHSGMFYTGADADFWEYAAYYQVPMLSVKAACWRLMHQGHPGFQVNRTRATRAGVQEPDLTLDNILKDTLFYWDPVHPNGETGHRAMADLVVHLLAQVERSLSKRPFSDAERKRVQERATLPPPMIKGNWESSGDRCFVDDSLQSLVVPRQPGDTTPTFVWMNDQAPGKRPKWGFIANETGATIQFKLDTRTASHRKGWADLHSALVARGDVMGQVAVEVAYLVSYQGMGKATVSCVQGCLCPTVTLDGLDTSHRVSLISILEIKVTMHKECMIQITATGTTSSSDPADQGTKVKISGVMVSDEGADLQAEGKDLKSFGALDFVTDGLRPNQSFEIQYTWR